MVSLRDVAEQKNHGGSGCRSAQNQKRKIFILEVLKFQGAFQKHAKNVNGRIYSQICGSSLVGICGRRGGSIFPLFRIIPNV